MKFIFSIILFFSIIISFAQSITNVASVQQGNDAIITYDLNGNSSDTYYVRLYYSTDGGNTFSKELLQVTGDVKNGVKSGKGKKIIWAAEKEVSNLDGSVIFKVEAVPGMTKAKPAVIEQYTLEVISATRAGDEVTIEFVLLQNADLVNFALISSSQLTTYSGTQFNASQGSFGPKEMTAEPQRKNQANCPKGVPVKGVLKFNNVQEDFNKIGAVKIDLYNFKGFTDSKMFSFVVNNIPLQ